eukprot:5281899-Prorocentrum_lima.AAC.1
MVILTIGMGASQAQTLHAVLGHTAARIRIVHITAALGLGTGALDNGELLATAVATWGLRVTQQALALLCIAGTYW